MLNRQIEIVDNRKIKITYDLMIWSMGYTMLELGQNPRLSGSREKTILPEQKPWIDKNHFEEKD